jgi:hypothetical protein
MEVLVIVALSILLFCFILLYLTEKRKQSDKIVLPKELVKEIITYNIEQLKPVELQLIVGQLVLIKSFSKPNLNTNKNGTSRKRSNSK